ncbi:MAG TPA: hypothetical protein VIJ70_07420 [Gaiellaceae bacterium]
MIHPEVMRLIMKERFLGLQNSARRAPHPEPVFQAAAPPADIELRLCSVRDDEALERLAALSERPLPFGRFVVAFSNGRLVAALPLGGGHVLRDPFVATEQLLPLLELRADQIRGRAPGRRLSLRPAALLHRTARV